MITYVLGLRNRKMSFQIKHFLPSDITHYIFIDSYQEGILLQFLSVCISNIIIVS